MASSRQSFRVEAVASGAASRFGGTVRTSASKGKQPRGITVNDPRVESAKTVLGALDAVIRAQPGSVPAGEEIPAPVYFAAIVSALRTKGAAHVDEVRAEDPVNSAAKAVDAVPPPTSRCFARSCCTCSPLL